MEKNKVDVSIISPSYNSSNFIKQTIESVIKQTLTSWELIIVDDFSSDDSIQVIEKCLSENVDKDIFLIKNKINLKAALSRNKAIEKAKGRFIAFLDTDDLWRPDKLEKQIKFMLKNNYPFTCTYYNQIDEEGNFLSVVDHIPNKISYSSLLKSNKVGCLTAVYDSHFFGKVYMDNIEKRQDYGLWLKLLKKTDYVYCLPEVLADYRIRENSISSNKRKLIKYHWFIYYHHEKLGFMRSLYLTASYVIRTIMKKFK